MRLVARGAGEAMTALGALLLVCPGHLGPRILGQLHRRLATGQYYTEVSAFRSNT
jgi:hypothetical protein